MPVSFHGQLVGVFKVDRKIILELKTADQISKAHEAQMLHYLRASEIEVGLIFNFGPQEKFRRMEFRNIRKGPVPPSALSRLDPALSPLRLALCRGD